MLRYGRNVAELGRGLRRLSVAVEPTSTVEPKLHQNFMTNEINPVTQFKREKIIYTQFNTPPKSYAEYFNHRVLIHMNNNLKYVPW